MNQAVAVKTSFRDVAIADHGGGGKLMPQTFGDVVSFSEIMARAQHAIPKHLRDVPGACLAVTMQALRWEMDPFAVASKSYNVKDIIAYEAQLIAAVVHTRAPLKTRPNYEYTGEGQDRRCKVSALFDDGMTRTYESPRVGDIKVKNSPLWTADTDQQLGYYSIRAFARRYCPETILGVYTPEEAEEFRGPDGARDVTPRPSLQERLTAGNAEAGEGFSQQHVVNEIDGSKPETPANTGGADEVTTQAAVPSDPDAAAPIQESASLVGAGDGEQAGGDLAAAPPGLPSDWPKKYADALRRAQKTESLKKLASQFWNQWGGWTLHADGPNAAKAKAVFGAFSQNFGDAEKINAVLFELDAA